LLKLLPACTRLPIPKIVARVEQGQDQGAGHQLSKQLETTSAGLDALYSGDNSDRIVRTGGTRGMVTIPDDARAQNPGGALSKWVRTGGREKYRSGPD